MIAQVFVSLVRAFRGWLIEGRCGSFDGEAASIVVRLFSLRCGSGQLVSMAILQHVAGYNPRQQPY